MNIELANLFFNVANLLFIVGSLSLIRDFIKNPFKYKIWSVWMTFLAMGSVNIAYGYLENHISMVLSIPTVLYWGIASIYSVYKRVKK